MTRVDPYKSFKFLLEIDNITQAGFSECSGLSSEVEIIEYREGGEVSYVNKMIGKSSYGDISLKWGATDSTELYDWHKNAIDGVTERKNGAVILLDDLGEEKIRWDFFEGIASKWEGPSFNATGNEVAIESLTISCQRIERHQ